MTNPFYNASGTPITGSAGASAVMRAEFLLIQNAFNLLPASLIPNTAVVVNAGGTALTTTAGTLSLLGNLNVASGKTVTLSNTLTLTATDGATLNIGTGGTLGPLAYIATGNSGGILGFTSTTTIASSATLTANAIVLGGGAGSTPTVLGSLGSATTVLHGNSGGAPSFAAVTLSTDVTGILPTANGGTGLSSADILLSDISFVIDGGGTTITTGVKGYLFIDFPCTINQVTMLGDESGSIVVDIWMCSYANFDAGSTHPVVGDSITASDKPTISSATKAQDSTLTGWTTSIPAGSVLAYDVSSVTSIQRLTVTLEVTKG